MRTETVSIFTFAELSEAAQEKALDNWRATGLDYAWSDEWRDSLKGFADMANITIKDYEISPYSYSFINWQFNPPHEWTYAEADPAETLRGARLRTWILNNWGATLDKTCPFTGYCGDEDALDPIRTFIKAPASGVSLLDLLNDCIESFRIAWERDLEYQNSDEYIRETIEANEYEFYADGSMV